MDLIFLRLIEKLLVPLLLIATISYTIYICSFVLKQRKDQRSNQVIKSVITNEDSHNFNKSRESQLEVNDNYYSGLVAVVAGIVAIALPLSISVITASKEKSKISSKELADTFYSEKAYKKMKHCIGYLAVVVVFSYFKSGSPFVFIPATLITLYVIYAFYKYLIVVELYVKDFAGMMVAKEQENLNGEF